MRPNDALQVLLDLMVNGRHYIPHIAEYMHYLRPSIIIQRHFSYVDRVK
jgi:hypothetical protein